MVQLTDICEKFEGEECGLDAGRYWSGAKTTISTGPGGTARTCRMGKTNRFQTKPKGSLKMFVALVKTVKMYLKKDLTMFLKKA